MVEWWRGSDVFNGEVGISKYLVNNIFVSFKSMIMFKIVSCFSNLDYVKIRKTFQVDLQGPSYKVVVTVTFYRRYMFPVFNVQLPPTFSFSVLFPPFELF